MRLTLFVAIALGVGETFAFLPAALGRNGFKTAESVLGLTAVQVRRKLGPGVGEGRTASMRAAGAPVSLGGRLEWPLASASHFPHVFLPPPMHAPHRAAPHRTNPCGDMCLCATARNSLHLPRAAAALQEKPWSPSVHRVTPLRAALSPAAGYDCQRHRCRDGS